MVVGHKSGQKSTKQEIRVRAFSCFTEHFSFFGLELLLMPVHELYAVIL